MMNKNVFLVAMLMTSVVTYVRAQEIDIASQKLFKANPREDIEVAKACFEAAQIAANAIAKLSQNADDNTAKEWSVAKKEFIQIAADALMEGSRDMSPEMFQVWVKTLRIMAIGMIKASRAFDPETAQQFDEIIWTVFSLYGLKIMVPNL